MVTESKLALSVFNVLRVPTIIADRDARAIISNKAAYELFEDGGPFMLSPEGKLTFGKKTDQLHALLNKACTDSRAYGAGVISSRHWEMDYRADIFVTPFELEDAASSDAPDARSGGYALVTVHSPSQRCCTGQFLRDTYGLSPAEVKLTLLLHKGLSATRVAKELGVSDTTIRSQLSSVFHKTNVTRQAELLLLVSTMSLVSFMDASV